MGARMNCARTTRSGFEPRSVSARRCCRVARDAALAPAELRARQGLLASTPPDLSTVEGSARDEEPVSVAPGVAAGGLEPRRRPGCALQLRQAGRFRRLQDLQVGGAEGRGETERPGRQANQGRRRRRARQEGPHEIRRGHRRSLHRLPGRRRHREAVHLLRHRVGLRARAGATDGTAQRRRRHDDRDDVHDLHRSAGARHVSRVREVARCGEARPPRPSTRRPSPKSSRRTSPRPWRRC